MRYLLSIFVLLNVVLADIKPNGLGIDIKDFQYVNHIDKNDKRIAYIHKEIWRCLKVVKKIYGVKLPYPQLVFSKGMEDQVLGMTYRFGQTDDPKLMFRYDLALNAPEFAYLNTVTHEMAHYIQIHLTGTSDHGGKWKTLMRQLGVTNSDSALADNAILKTIDLIDRIDMGLKFKCEHNNNLPDYYVRERNGCIKSPTFRRVVELTYIK